MSYNDLPIGARIRQLRDGLMTQQDLATSANVSVDLVRKLEQGRRHTASVGSLHGIARALDVDLAELLSKATPMPSIDPDTGVVAIRRALTPVDDLLPDPEADDEPLDLNAAQRTVDYLWGVYWAGRYELLASLLPTALTQPRATWRAARSDEQASAASCLTPRTKPPATPSSTWATRMPHGWRSAKPWRSPPKATTRC